MKNLTDEAKFNQKGIFMTAIKLDQNKFLDNIIAAFNNQFNNDPLGYYVIYDTDGKILEANNKFVQLHDYSNSDSLQQKTLNKIYKFHKSSPNFCDGIKTISQQVIDHMTAMDYLFISEFSSGMAAYLAQQVPICNSDGMVVAIAASFSQIPHYNPNATDEVLSKRQSEIAFLLSIGASQKEIASIFNVSRGTIAKTIENICIRLDISGSSERNIIEKATQLGCARLPIDMASPGVIPISKLFYNYQMLTLFKHKMNKNTIGN